MALSLPSEVDQVSFSGIETRTQDIEEQALDDPAAWAVLTADRQTQEYFLNNFKKTFNISLSLSLVSKGWSDFSRWRSTDIHFVQQYNDIHKHWQSRVMASAASRAVGYTTKCDPKTPTVSGLLEDAQGSVIYQGADSKLTVAFLAASHPEQFGTKTDVTINTSPAIRDITPDDDGSTAADLYGQLMNNKR